MKDDKKRYKNPLSLGVHIRKGRFGLGKCTGEDGLHGKEDGRVVPFKYR